MKNGASTCAMARLWFFAILSGFVFVKLLLHLAAKFQANHGMEPVDLALVLLCLGSLFVVARLSRYIYYRHQNPSRLASVARQDVEKWWRKSESMEIQRRFLEMIGWVVLFFYSAHAVVTENVDAQTRSVRMILVLVIFLATIWSIRRYMKSRDDKKD